MALSPGLSYIQDPQKGFSIRETDTAGPPSHNFDWTLFHTLWIYLQLPQQMYNYIPWPDMMVESGKAHFLDGPDPIF